MMRRVAETANGIRTAATLPGLPVRWRAQAAEYERDGQSGAALLRRVAGELDAALAATDGEPLTLEDASKVSGYSVAHLRRLVAGHRLANVGGGREIRVRRCELPRKPGATLGPDLVTPVLGRVS